MDRGFFSCIAILWVVVVAAGSQWLGDYGYIAKVGFLPVLIWAAVARLRDIGKNRWYAAFLLLPLFNLMMLLYLMFAPGKPVGPIGPALAAEIAEAATRTQAAVQ